MNSEGYSQHKSQRTFQRSSKLFARELIILSPQSCFSPEHSLDVRPLRSWSETCEKSWSESTRYNCSFRRCSDRLGISAHSTARARCYLVQEAMLQSPQLRSRFLTLWMNTKE